MRRHTGQADQTSTEAETVSVDVAVVIVSYNTAHLIVDCLDSLFAETTETEMRVTVIDNGSSDQSVAILTGYPTVQCMTSSENLGFGRAVNRAAESANAEFLVLLNPDTVVLDHAIDRLVEFARSNPGHGIYGGRAVHRDGSLERSSCWGLPTVWSLTCFALGLSTVFRNSALFDPESLGSWQRDSVKEVGMVTGCLLLVPMSLWRELNGFDDRYFMYGEDADLAYRVRGRGFRPIITPEACIVHDVGGASATKAEKLQLLYQGKATLLRAHFNGWRRRVVLTELAVGVGLRAALTGFSSRGTKRSMNAWQQLWRTRRRWLSGYESKQ